MRKEPQKQGLWLLLPFLLALGPACAMDRARAEPHEQARLVAKGRYLTLIGACEACHTPPAVPEAIPAPDDVEQIAKELLFRTDPNWVRYLDHERRYAGGVPFILRFDANTGGVVYTRNITPDNETGIGTWSINDIVKVLRTGIRKDGTVLFVFPPHTFYKNLSEDDARAIATYLKTLPPVRFQVLERQLPFEPQPMEPSPFRDSPRGRNEQRALYLTSALIGCKECHSYHDARTGALVEWVGGDRQDPFTGVFRMGPDLPLRQNEKGFAAFPYPGYSVSYGTNLTQFGLGGHHSSVNADAIVKAIRQGISPMSDREGRPRPLSHIMLWQFYAGMSDDDAYAIAEYIKSLSYVPHEVVGLRHFGVDWELAFEYIFGEPPSPHDRELFGKTP